MRTQLMTLAPEAVRSTPHGESVWEKALIEFVRGASAEGMTVVVSTEVTTMTPDEVARGLNLSRSTVSRRIADGTIRSSGIVNSREHLESLLVAQETGFASMQDYLLGTRPPSARQGGEATEAARRVSA